MGVYHETGVDGWDGATDIYVKDLRGLLADDEGRTWAPIHIWSDPNYEPNTMPLKVTGDLLFTPPTDRVYTLELLHVPPEVAADAPPVGTTWTVMPTAALNLQLPTYRTADGLTGYQFAFTVGCALDPPDCAGDANCDGFVNFRDIDFFVAGMNDNVAAWEDLFWPSVPCCPFDNCDANGDGFVNFRDIDPLVALMNTACP